MAQIEGLVERLYRERYVGFRNALAPVVGSREAAHDVVQEAFANALAEVGKLRRAESLAPWVWQIALRIALRQRRRGMEIEIPADLSIPDEERDPALAAPVRSLPPPRSLGAFLPHHPAFIPGEIAQTLR